MGVGVVGVAASGGFQAFGVQFVVGEGALVGPGLVVVGAVVPGCVGQIGGAGVGQGAEGICREGPPLKLRPPYG